MLAWTIHISFIDAVVLMHLVRGNTLMSPRKIDFAPPNDDKRPMSTAKKAAKASGRARESRTWGTRMAAEIRAKCNKLTRAEREALLERAMRIAYGTDAQPAKTRRR